MRGTSRSGSLALGELVDAADGQLQACRDGGERLILAERKATDAGTRRTEGLAAVSELASALADHRRAMWVREDLRLRGQDWTAARAESHATRSAITAPLLRVQVLLPAVADAAQAAYSLREAGSGTGLNIRRDHAITTADRLVTAASALAA